eukprot:3862267-Pyramimonas_sp.AAC.1
MALVSPEVRKRLAPFIMSNTDVKRLAGAMSIPLAENTAMLVSTDQKCLKTEIWLPTSLTLRPGV